MSSTTLENHIKFEMGIKQVSENVARAIDDYFAETKAKHILASSALSYAKHFVSCGIDPSCMHCGANPRVREEERYCSSCKNGRPVPKEVKDAYKVYMATVFSRLYDDIDMY